MAHNNGGTNRRSARIGLTTLTTAGLLATAVSSAHAEVVTTLSGLTTTTAPTGNPTDGSDIFFSFATGQAQKTAFTGYQYRLNSTSTSLYVATDGVNSYLADCIPPKRLQQGYLISGDNMMGNDTYTTSAGPLADSSGNAEWQLGDSGYLGIRLGSNGNYNYGWADVTVRNDYTATLNRFAYETVPNQGIQAGSTVSIVPEANPLELLLLGAAGLGAYRLLQKKRETTETSA